MIQRFTGSVCVFLLVAFLAGCSSTPSQPSNETSPTPSVTVSISPQPAFVASGQTMQFTATVTGSSGGVEWLVNGIIGGSSAAGTIDNNGNYTAPVVTQNATATVTAGSTGDPSQSASSATSIVAPGQVTPTNNPQVALYTIAPPTSGNVSIQFGPDTNYGLTTWTQPAPNGGGPVSIYVAGMRANTQYHMRAAIQFAGNTTVNDSDHTFTTGALPTAELPNLTVATTPGQTPQGGVELLDLINGTQPSQLSGLVTDLEGNVLWGYNPGLAPGVDAQPIKMLPNGHFLIGFGLGSPDGAGSVLQEVDLGGNLIWQMTAAQLNQALAAATCPGCNIKVVGTHHDFAILPNGHVVLIAALQQVENNLTGFSSPVTVTGDVLIDLDQNHNPVWVWNEFDHLDVNRHPYMFPDWTHTNSVVYSGDDKALIISSRHQFWVMKIDYGDGQGTGNILWRLGWQGDFTLMNGTDPIDWQYAQHDANVISSNSSGTFQVLVFDNGDNRVLDDSGDVCGTTTPCYSRVPIFQIDESAKTATLQWIDNLSPIYSFYGGSARQLLNGDLEFAECAPANPGVNPSVFEVTKTAPPQTVWQMHITGQSAYRVFRIPSMYPGVQW